MTTVGRLAHETGPVAQYTVNNKIITTSGERGLCDSPHALPKKEDLAKVV